MKLRAEFVDKSNYKKCWVCQGTGIKDVKNLKNITKCEECKFCQGTGRIKEEFHHLIYTDKDGHKVCFGVDGIK